MEGFDLLLAHMALVLGPRSMLSGSFKFKPDHESGLDVQASTSITVLCAH